MKFIHVLALVLTQLSVGTLLLSALVSPRSLPAPFFTFNTLLATVLAAVALLLTKITLAFGWWEMRFLGLAVIVGTVAYGCYHFEYRDVGRVFAILAGLLGLVLGLLPMADKLLVAAGIATKLPYGFAATTMAGAMLLGAAYVAMFMSQWDSYVPGPLLKEMLGRMVLIAGIALLLRLLLLVVALTALPRLNLELAQTHSPGLWSDDLPLLGARVLFGLAAPGVLLGRVFLHLREQRTGPVPASRLGLVFASVLVGELCAGFLLI